MREDLLGEEEEFAAHPSCREEEGEGDRDQFYRKTQGLLLHLRKGLQQTDEQPDHGRHYDRHEGEAQRDQKRGLCVFQNLCLHGVFPLWQVTLYQALDQACPSIDHDEEEKFER